MKKGTEKGNQDDFGQRYSALKDVERTEKAWPNYNTLLLRTIFSTRDFADEHEASIFVIRRSENEFEGISPESQLSTLRTRLFLSLQGQTDSLQSIIDRLELIDEDVSSAARAAAPRSEDHLGTLADRFDLVVRQLLRRHDGRQTLAIEDEYDVQDLLRALLTIFYDDIRKEEWTPSYLAGASRMDFLLPRSRPS